MGLPSHNVRLATPTSAGVYARHRPETTLLYQIIREYWPEFQLELASQDKYLPACSTLEHGFPRVRCESCHDNSQLTKQNIDVK